MEEQTKLFLLNNQNLFSNNYLDYRLPETDLWKGQKDNAAAVFEEISKSYELIRSSKLGPGEEAELEDKFIKPVLSALGYTYHVQVPAKRGAKKEVPDYALFKDNESYKAARKVKDNLDQFFSQSLTILEAKYWGRKLNDADKKDILDSRDPTAQTVKYLDSVNYHTGGKINWAILTNGKLWRLFYFRASSRSGNYFEIDPEEIIKRRDSEAFHYFYLFFSKDAFLPDPVSGNTWLDIHLKGAEDYAARVSTKLKDRIFDQVFEGLATGFIHFRHTELGIAKETEESRREIFKGCLTLLYRLLFILYAESRNLLPVSEDGYDKLSLSKLKKDIYQDLKTTEHDKMSMRSSVYWARLQSLFEIIAKGDPALNVPIYNGGLFETLAGEFLSMHKMPDRFLAEAIEQLTVDHEGDYKPGMIPFIDYSSLNVRHLGDIYEGLLEFHIQIAQEDIAEIREKGKSVWKKLSELKAGTKTQRLKKTGEVYIENSKHERKATGSYYTPHYIVEYIVKNTVGPVLKERLKIAKDLLSQITTASKAQKKQVLDGNISVLRNKLDVLERTLFETIFDIKVLDPAMGSGHFLVHAVDYITDGIVTFLVDHPENPVIRKIEELRGEIVGNVTAQGVRIDESKLTEVNLIKRMVLKRCIYGVDLNEMAVELAKLSLWLDSFTLGAPLSFLDHHLKYGNSLIGVLDIATVIPVSQIFSEYQKALSFMIQVSELTDATISEAKKSYDLYSQGQKAIGPIRRRFNVATAKYFMDIGTSLKRVEQLAATLDFDKEPYAEIVEKCKGALQIAEEKKFFHWRLEFPEVFYTEKSEKENPGFDCVIGNPPYGLLSKEAYFKQSLSFINPSWDIYVAFFERGISVVKKDRLVSYIVPVSWETGAMFEKLREYLLSRTSLKKLVNLPFDIFKDAYIDTCIFVVEKAVSAANKALVYEFPKKIKIDDIIDVAYKEIEQSLWQVNKNQIIVDSNALLLLPRLFSNSHKLGEITDSVRGVLASPEFISHDVAKGYPPFFDGEMLRYEISEPNKFILYSEELPEKPADVAFFSGTRVFIRRLISRQDRLMSTCVTDFFINKKDIYIFKNKGEYGHYSPYFLTALLNSKLLSFLYLSQETVSRKDDFRQATLEGTRNLPIPHVSFATPNKERKEFFSEAVQLYRDSKVNEVLKWADYELALKRNDTVHDFLAYLAEQMIEMNKKKIEEIKSFLKWLEREIGAEIEDLTNKTAIKEYHEHEFINLLDVLKKNKNKISTDPSARKTQKLFETHFAKRIKVLSPLKALISETDVLIDQIVYKLYALSPEEIAIVEGKS